MNDKTMVWQPIENAPRDGTKVIGACFDEGRCYWVSDVKFTHPIGWYSINGQRRNGLTHYMPWVEAKDKQ